ncbi:hypothetical protein CAOG_002051 [Capsaspora owczarzaki ATCC 30864]|uniref:EF-hand domain-containing protein n=1 Tax=Capsaspora owczarzaki (strain ATCC 30864) TaxID=595528 RepID=A0A0D2WKI9_CAPO3|nr:hypothetical protein CAOG_002051 [Capsaspora owczarzaki ATCC 30864]
MEETAERPGSNGDAGTTANGNANGNGNHTTQDKVKRNAARQDQGHDGDEHDGTEEDAEEEAETTAMDLKDLFASCDLDNNGVIDLNDLRQVTTTLGISITPEGLQELFDVLDTNRDGVVTQDEFSLGMQAWLSSAKRNRTTSVASDLSPEDAHTPLAAPAGGSERIDNLTAPMTRERSETDHDAKQRLALQTQRMKEYFEAQLDRADSHQHRLESELQQVVGVNERLNNQLSRLQPVQDETNRLTREIELLESEKAVWEERERNLSHQLRKLEEENLVMRKRIRQIEEDFESNRAVLTKTDGRLTEYLSLQKTLARHETEMKDLATGLASQQQHTDAIRQELERQVAATMETRTQQENISVVSQQQQLVQQQQMQAVSQQVAEVRAILATASPSASTQLMEATSTPRKPSSPTGLAGRGRADSDNGPQSSLQGELEHAYQSSLLAGAEAAAAASGGTLVEVNGSPLLLANVATANQAVDARTGLVSASKRQPVPQQGAFYNNSVGSAVASPTATPTKAGKGKKQLSSDNLGDVHAADDAALLSTPIRANPAMVGRQQSAPLHAAPYSPSRTYSASANLVGSPQAVKSYGSMSARADMDAAERLNQNHATEEARAEVHSPNIKLQPYMNAAGINAAGIDRSDSYSITSRTTTASEMRRMRWVPDFEVKECQSCTRSFFLFRRRHHCRSSCSKSQMCLPQIGYIVPVRVCDTCYRDGNPLDVASELLINQPAVVPVVTSSDLARHY